MDISTIIVAVIALIGSISGTYFANQKTTALIALRLENLEKKVEKHNNLVERMYAVEKDLTVLKSEVEDLKHESV